jgi:iron complex outermembrane receptor protein
VNFWFPFREGKSPPGGGSFGFIEPSVDLSGPINASETLKYRLNGLYRREDGFREPFDEAFERVFVAPSGGDTHT